MQFKSSIVAVMALSGLAAAQIPSCATECLASAISSATTCGATDLACQCTAANMAAIQGAATPCVLGACQPSEIAAVLAGAQAECAGAGTSTPSSSSAPVAPSSSTVAPSSSAPASTYVPISTSAPASTSAAPSTLKSSAAPSATASSNSTVSPTPVPFTGSASSMVASLGSVFAIGFVVLAAF